MLQPKRVKYRRPHSLSYEGIATKGNTVEFGEWGLQALEGAYLTDRQIESARIVLARYTDRAGKIWIRVFPHLAKTKKPAEVRMGSGKGSPEGWVAVCKEGRKAPHGERKARKGEEEPRPEEDEHQSRETERIALFFVHDNSIRHDGAKCNGFFRKAKSTAAAQIKAPYLR